LVEYCPSYRVAQVVLENCCFFFCFQHRSTWVLVQFVHCTAANDILSLFSLFATTNHEIDDNERFCTKVLHTWSTRYISYNNQPRLPRYSYYLLRYRHWLVVVLSASKMTRSIDVNNFCLKSLCKKLYTRFVVHYMMITIHQYGTVSSGNQKVNSIGVRTTRIVMRNLVVTVVRPKLTCFLVVFAETWTIAQLIYNCYDSLDKSCEWVA
jgi:hypothetical protein